MADSTSVLECGDLSLWMAAEPRWPNFTRGRHDER
jgi:hypothetical protein